MALATIDDVALELGEPVPTGAKAAQWQTWLDRAEWLIEHRLGPIANLNPVAVENVEVMAVAAKVARPDSATQVQVTVDDGSVSRRYESSSGRVEILDEWWALLVPVVSPGSAFTIAPS